MRQPSNIEVHTEYVLRTTESSSEHLTIMELKFFTDLIDAPGKVVGGLRAIVYLHKAERETIRHTLKELYR